MGNKQYSLEKQAEQQAFHPSQAKLVYISHSKYETDWHSYLHSHPFTELFYVMSGQGQFLIEHEQFEVKANDLIIVNANVSHTETSKADCPMEYIVIGIEGISLLNAEYDQSMFYSLNHFQEQDNPILSTLKMLLGEIVDKKERYEWVIQNMLEILLIHVLRHTKTKLKISSNSKTNNHASYLQSYIDEHFKEKISLEDLCRISFMNKYYMVHHFKKHLGITPIAYLNQKRLEESCHLLENTNLSISKIAEAIGMSSATYFNQAFKKHYQCAPLEWRKKQKNKAQM